MEAKQKMFLSAESIHRYVSGIDEELDILIMTRDDVVLSTTDQLMYEALGAFEDRLAIDMNRFVKFLERVQIQQHQTLLKEPRTILSHERAEQIRSRKKVNSNSEKGTK